MCYNERQNSSHATVPLKNFFAYFSGENIFVLHRTFFATYTSIYSETFYEPCEQEAERFEA